MKKTPPPPPPSPLLAAIESDGWLYQTGGAGPYVSLFARVPGTKRADVDGLVAEGRLRIVTSVRGCTMLVPKSSAELARAGGKRAWAEIVAALARAGEVTPEALAGMEERVRTELAAGAVDALGLGRRLGGVPNLGPVAKKLGYATLLPIALRSLESQGSVERTPPRLRLDDERYVWRIPAPTPGGTLPTDLELTLARLLARWLRAAPSKADIAAWIGCSAAEANKLVAGAAPKTPPAARSVVERGTIYLPSRDPYLANRTGIGALVASEHRNVLVGGWERKPVAIGAVERLHHHAILHNGQIVGLWEWVKTGGGRIVSGFFGERPAGWAEAEERTAQFVREELGDLFIYGRDAAEARAVRVGIVKGLGG